MEKKPLIIAHRGNGNHDYPENTIEACEQALAEGADALEVDVRFCATGELVIFHDITLKRVMGKSGALISTTLNELKNLSLFRPGNNKPIYVPTLKQFINHFKNTVPINLEAKVFTPIAGQFAKYIVRAVKASGIREQFWISSFNPVFLRTVKYCSWDIKTGYLFKTYGPLKRMLEKFWFTDYWQPEINLVDEKFINLANKHNKDIYIWTVNENEDIQRTLKLSNLKGIITDIPSAVRQQIDHQQFNV